MKASYEELDKHYKEFMGDVDIRDSFLENHNHVTRDIRGDFFVSRGKAITIDVLEYGFMCFGVEDRLHIYEYRDRKLRKSLFIVVKYILKAQDGDDFDEPDYNGFDEPRRYFGAKHYKNGSVFLYVRGIYGDNKRKHGVVLTKEELDYICSKLSRLVGYEPLL